MTLLTSLALVALAQASCPQACEPRLWVRGGDSMPTPPTDYLDLRGRGGLGVPFRLLIERQGPSGAVRITAFIADRSIGRFGLDLARYRGLDLSSGEVQFDARDRLEITFRYGEVRGCFIGDDGRNRVKVAFRRGDRVRVYDTRVENCEISMEEVSLPNR